MKLMLIAPASGRWYQVGRRRWFNGKTFRFSLLSMLRVAAETPEGWEIGLVDEQVDDIPWEETPDLVGITCMTAAAPRAFEIAQRFRERGVKVVLGGMYPSLCPEEALAHADAVVVGDAEGLWPQVLHDAEKDRLQGIYRHAQLPSLEGISAMPRHLLNRRCYATIHAVEATRGCPNRCDFCAVSAFHQHSQRRRPVESVLAEVAAIPERHFIFIDDHLVADFDYARTLFEGLIPLNKRWVAQMTLSMTEDEELVDLAARAGCVGVFVGLESLSSANLDSVNKSFHRAEHYAHAIELFHAHGIGVEAGLVFGFDGDTHSVFRQTLNLLDQLQVDAIQASILTPLPGTKRHEAMQHRIVDEDLGHYDFHHAVFQPRAMSTDALQAGHDWITREFYRPHRILRRLWRHLRRPRGWRTVGFVLAINLAYFGRVMAWSIRGHDPAESPVPEQLGKSTSADLAPYRG